MVKKTFSYGFYESPFGRSCLAFSSEGLHALIFADNDESALVDLHKRFPAADFVPAQKQAEITGKDIFSGHPVAVKTYGTPFQQTVWNALLEIPYGETSTYALIAEKTGNKKAVRAVGTAVGANPVSYLIPCHRVLRTDGGLGGYRWGLERKKQMLEKEGVKSI